MGLLAQTFIAINRLDLAENQIKAMSQKEDDSSITLLTSARVYLSLVNILNKASHKNQYIFAHFIYILIFSHYIYFYINIFFDIFIYKFILVYIYFFFDFYNIIIYFYLISSLIYNFLLILYILNFSNIMIIILFLYILTFSKNCFFAQ